MLTVSKTFQIKQRSKCSSRANAREGSSQLCVRNEDAAGHDNEQGKDREWVVSRSWCVISFALNIIYTNYTFECIHLLFIGQLDRGPELSPEVPAGLRLTPQPAMNNSIDWAWCLKWPVHESFAPRYECIQHILAPSAWARLKHLVIIVYVLPSTMKIKVNLNELTPKTKPK